jgi:arylsulfatase
MPGILAGAGYRTGIFGKWHLGDTYPYRPQDRGFDTAVWFPSSHIGAVPDYWENDYFDDMYYLNDKRTKYEGYTTDVFFREAIAWMKKQTAAGQPFFCYIPTAAPHAPHFVPDKYEQALQAAFDAAKDKLPEVRDPNALVSFLAMIANIDENMGHLETFLRESGIRDDTILIFLTDNGSTFAPQYYPAGMRGHKTTLWEGGHRVPCFVRWPGGKLRKPGDVGGLTQVQDILPTLLDLCGVPAPPDARFDGISLAPVLRGKANLPDDRMLVINYSRMPFFKVTYTKENPSIPKREGACVLWKRWRLLTDSRLYNLASDPMQEHNVIAENPIVTGKMRAHLDAWWAGVRDVCMKPQPSVIGSPAQNPVTLTACEWFDVFVDQQGQVRRGVRKNGTWYLEVAHDGEYTFELRRYPAESGLGLADATPKTRVTDGMFPAGPAFDIAGAKLKIGKTTLEEKVASGAQSVRFKVQLHKGPTTMKTWFLDLENREIAGAYYVVVTRRESSETN